ncbi:MAG: glycoside hydrolase family 3 C-terminal domain-containing protein [Dysgonamonadaceae bacterium]|jgi:beta-glucosidase|nr:glycoside hydrolase family 3 C-terminal domain-containing protein [Dysgonamonadaceae bacterium]
MKIKTNCLLVLIFCSFSCFTLLGSNNFDEQARELLNKLTLEEKVSLMINNSAAVERLGIPPYEWWNEALHGIARNGQATVFPQAIGLAATFDDQAVYEMFDMVSDEARAKHHEAKRNNEFKRYQGLTFWTPNINIFRDPRWGRGMETYGEDPYLTSMMGIACVRGLQGDPNATYDKAHACAKHYAVHSGPEWNRHSFDAKNISQRDLWETYLPAFKELVVTAGVKEVMCAYNRFEGTPCCGSHTLLVDILRNKWGFDNVVVSDCWAINDFFRAGHHETHATTEEAVADAVIAGTDLECGDSYSALIDAVKSGLISEEQIDVSVFRLLRARFELGLFEDDANVSWASIPMSVVECNAHKAKALEMARKSMVLLSNKNNTLPLSKNLKKIAVMGPNANDSVMLWANYNGFPTRSVTILQGIQSKVPAGSVIYEKACDWVNDQVFYSRFGECAYDGKAGFKATFWNTTDFSGDAVAASHFSNPFVLNTGGATVFAPGVNLNDFSAKFESVFTPTRTENIVFRSSASDEFKLYINDELVFEHNIPAYGRFFTPNEYVMNAVQGEQYRIRIDFIKGAQGYAILNFDLGNKKEVDYAGIAAEVSDVDAIVFVGGISSSLEGEEMRVNFPGFKGGDRTNIDLPAVQVKMLEALKKTGKPIIFVLCSGSTIALTQEAALTDAILAAWYPGQEGGTAVADVLFGDYNPAGRLPLTFYASSDQLPDFEDYDMSKGRTYRYFKGKPLYPFGYGLSYTTFQYENATLSKSNIGKNENLSLNLSLKNTGASDGDEVIQVYVRNLQDSNGPLKSLRAFKRVNVKAGATEQVKIDLPSTAFEFFDEQTGIMTVKSGKYEVLYGGSSADKALKKLIVQIN